MSVLAESAQLVDIVILATSGDQIADNIKTIIAPIAGILIGLVGLKYLFGENRSLAGFLGFLFLGVCVYALIQFGKPILDALSGLVQFALGTSGGGA